MSKYASLLRQTSKYKRIGQFRLPVYGGLTTGEAAEIEEISRQQAKHTYKTLQLAQRISKDKNISVKEVLDRLGKLGSGEADALVEEYLPQLAELEAESVSAMKQKISYVTVGVRCRAELCIEGKWTRLEDWEEDDTAMLPVDVTDQLFEFISHERDGITDEGNAPAPAEDNAS